MLKLKRNVITIEIEEYDLWELSIALKRGIVSHAQINLIKYFKGHSDVEFLNFVRRQSHPHFQYLSEIFVFLKREDLLRDFEEEIRQIFLY